MKLLTFFVHYPGGDVMEKFAEVDVIYICSEIIAMKTLACMFVGKKMIYIYILPVCSTFSLCVCTK
jgi:hypothetical protein